MNSIIDWKKLSQLTTTYKNFHRLRAISDISGNMMSWLNSLLSFYGLRTSEVELPPIL